MRDALLRRTFLGRLASLPLFGLVGGSFFARRADAASAAIIAQIDEAERRCLATKQAFTAAVEAFEAALPPPHPSIDFTGRTAWLGTTVEQRYADGARPTRALLRGYPTLRRVVTVETIGPELRACPPAFRQHRKHLRRMMFRAAQRDAETKGLEKAFGLEGLYQAREDANQAMEELVKAVFAQPATTMAAVLVQARMISAYTSAITEQHATYQAGRFGQQLAANLQQLGAAA